MSYLCDLSHWGKSRVRQVVNIAKKSLYWIARSIISTSPLQNIVIGIQNLSISRNLGYIVHTMLLDNFLCILSLQRDQILLALFIAISHICNFRWLSSDILLEIRVLDLFDHFISFSSFICIQVKHSTLITICLFFFFILICWRLIIFISFIFCICFLFFIIFVSRIDTESFLSKIVVFVRDHVIEVFLRAVCIAKSNCIGDLVCCV